MDYLTSRPQYVRVHDTKSEIITTNIGAPQGYITNNDHAAYQSEVDSFVSWCDDAHLILHIDKTKELIFDFKRKKIGQPVEVVPSYEYLGVHLDNKLDWKENSRVTFKKAQSRLFFLRKLRAFDMGRPILNIFYHGILESVLFYAVVCWGGSITVEDRNRFNKMIRKAGSIIGSCPNSVEEILDKRVMRKMRSVLSRDDHSLHNIFNKSGRSQRLLLLRCSTERFRRSFVPTAIRLFNKSCYVVTYAVVVTYALVYDL
ncbi:hypothetical protein N1851_012371 [Merluccius polli]|uniref:Alkylated DNA repair protein AlkB homologue 8 N-terminal domain-containing protein n=1 Tax=Merluccius polli TaxID=89951 RepID=A0AA47MXB4_MERPO|nr:hypothetical protein N1851_012371 [Merluccius polli]